LENKLNFDNMNFYSVLPLLTKALSPMSHNLFNHNLYDYVDLHVCISFSNAFS